MNKIRTGTAAVALGFAVVMSAPGETRAEGLEGAAEPNTTIVRKSVILGGGVLIKPKYEGAKKHRAYAIPLVIPKLSESNGDDGDPSFFKKVQRRVKFRGLDDIRIMAVRRGAVEVGGLTGYNTGRDQDDADRLRGLGDVDGGIVLGGYGGLHIGSVMFDAALINQVTGDSTGYQVRFGAETERQISRRISVLARAGATFASDEYMRAYFGVTPTQAATSVARLPVFRASSGIKDVHMELGARVGLSERWTMKMGGRYGRLLGDAADSPVIETKNQWSGSLGLGYKFYLSR